jgi:hypothetical protein
LKLAKSSQVERTLRLWADSEMKSLQGEPVNKSSNKPTIKAVSKLNPQTGVVSNIAAQFSADKCDEQQQGEILTSEVCVSVRRSGDLANGRRDV